VAERIAILGAGAVGGMLGALLASAGHDVTVLASDRTSTAINNDGLVLRSERFGHRHVRVPARPWLTTPVDLLFVAVKAPDLLAAATRVPGQLVREAAIVPLLNGVDHVPLLRAMFPESTVVPMTVAVEATRLGPGVVEHLSPFADYAIAAGPRPAVVDPATLLVGAGLPVDTSAPDEATLLWRKLSFLAPFALLTTVTREPIGPARQARPDLLDALVDETAAAAAPRSGDDRAGPGPGATAEPAGRHAVLHAQGRAHRLHAGARRHRRPDPAGGTRWSAGHPRRRRRDLPRAGVRCAGPTSAGGHGYRPVGRRDGQSSVLE
jgi:2-dehydropantoate 2-reductase